MFEVEGGPLPYGLIDGFLNELPVCRMSSAQYEFDANGRCWTALKDPERLIGPIDFSTGDSPAKAARAAQPLRLGQVTLVPPQGILSALAFRLLARFGKRPAHRWS